ncbi:MAG TPA: carbon-nitrogen hydrolase family protein [Candidatus Rubrimentiphilum sp.]|nr:carbon-nitrogen hydrolase family protein [Candidatus Rubrimentiphilum sp.]
MPRKITAAAIQLRAHERKNLTQTWPAIRARIAEAASKGARLIVLPEGTLPAYVLGYQDFAPAELGAILSELGQLAAQLQGVIVVGAARSVAERTYNSALVFDSDGTLAGAADKYFLWHFDRQWFAPGNDLRPIRTSIGQLGVLICADGRIPTIASTLVDRGAEVLVMPTAWVTSGRDPQNLENVQADLLARIRARENGVPFIAANKCGVELHCVAYCGKSQIIDAEGNTLAKGSQSDEAIVLAEISIGEPHPARDAGSLKPPTAGPNHAAHSQRIAVSHKDIAPGSELLRIVEADIVITPATAASLNQQVPQASAITGADFYDPRALVERRLSGYDLAIWLAEGDDGWQADFARARALELRLYVVVLDPKGRRAYVVDPDGAIVCGTFGDYEIAGFTFDPQRTAQTLVAPGTDIQEGLARVHATAT